LFSRPGRRDPIHTKWHHLCSPLACH
jgi:hypothetical protein